ncbi:MAG TPA: hypothetical protein VGE76_18090 [Opitutaceae bacterium]
MKPHPALSLAVLLVSIAGNLAAAETDAQRIARYLDYRKLPRLTTERIDIEGPMRTMCLDPRTLHGPHLVSGIHLYATKAVIDTRATSASPRYPVGALLVKEKFDTREAASPSIITVMEKVADAGSVDDWRFTMVRIADRSIVKDGFRVSCASCHERYKRFDYVSHVTDALLAELTKKR